MDSYFMDQIIGSYDECFFGTVSCSSEYNDWYSGFNYDPNFYHYRVSFKVVAETKKAFLFEVKEGQFWCPKSLLRNIRRNGDTIKALLWDQFNATFIEPQPDLLDAFDNIPDDPVPKLREYQKKALEKIADAFGIPTKMISKDKGKAATVYDAEWARNEGLI